MTPATATVHNAHLYVEGEEFLFSSLDGTRWIPVNREGHGAEDAAQLARLIAGDDSFRPMTFHRDYLTAKGAMFHD